MSTAETTRIWDIDEDGCVFNVETGEVYSTTEAFQTLEVPGELQSLASPWDVDSRETAEEALQRLAVIDSEIAALKLRLAAVTEGITAQIRQKERRRTWWEYRWSFNLINFARRQLRGKGKTAQFDHGKVSFRDVPETIEIIDEQAAIDWMSKWAPERIKTKAWVNKTDVQAVRKSLVEDGINEIPAFLVEHPRKENVPSIKTGI